MANDGKIYITISDTRGGKGGPGTNPNVIHDDKKEKEQNNPLADYAKHQFFSLIKSQATKVVNASIANIGNFTGDYAHQEYVTDVMNSMNSLLGIGMSAIAGTKIAGPIGGLIAVGVAGIGMGVSQGLQLYAGYQQNARQNRDIAQLRTRAGLNSTNNGNRGTNQ